MLVTNPAARAPLSEVMNHPWMIRNYGGPPDIHLVHREPLRVDELDRQVIRGMMGFEFGTEDEIERKLIAVLESDGYQRALQNWERKRGVNGNGSGAYSTRWGQSMSNSSLAISFDSKNEPPTPSKKSRRFSGFDYYRRKLFSPASSPPGSPLSHSPPNSSDRLAHPFTDAHRDPPDPTRGFHPLISMYYLAREKLERDKVYGPGRFASSQLSISDPVPAVAANAIATPVDASNPHLSTPTPKREKDATPTSNAKADYSMPLPRLPLPETSHYSGMSYNTSPTTPTTPTFHPQPRARDPGLPPPSPSAAKRQQVDMMEQQQQQQQQVLGDKLPRAPPASTHKRSHSLSQRPNAPTGRWGMFGGHEVVDELGVNNESLNPDHSQSMAPPEKMEVPAEVGGRERDQHGESDREHHGTASPFSTGATLVRKFHSMLVGTNERKHSNGTMKRGTFRPSGDTTGESDGEKVKQEKEKEKEKDTASEDAGVKTPIRTISASLSQPVGNVHRRAATILDPQGRTTRHERRSSTGAALIGGTIGGTIGRHRRPSTGYSSVSSNNKPLSDRLFPKSDRGPGELAEKGEEDEEDDVNGQTLIPDGEETFKEEDERHTNEKDFKPVFLKGLFR